MKGVSGLITFVLTVSIILTTITVVWLAGKPVVDKSQESAVIGESTGILNSFDTVIKDVVYGKAGSSRLIQLSITNGKYKVNSNDNSIEFSLDTSDTFIEPSGQLKSGNLYKSGARDVVAYQRTINGVESLVLENSHTMFAIRSLPSTASINTSNLTILMRNKDLNVNVTPAESTIILDDLSSTALGSGTTSFVDNGTTFGVGQIVAHVVSGSYDYNIYYTLHSNADFISIDVRNSSNAKNVTYTLTNSFTSGLVLTGSKFISYYNNTVATGIYHNSGNLISTTNDANSRINLQQNYSGNGIMEIVTKGPGTIITNGNINDINKWSGSFGYGVNKKAKYYSWLYYPIINLTRNETLSKGQYKLYIYNNGTSNGKAQIEISII